MVEIPNHSSLIARLWRGRVPLPLTYWLYGVVISIALTAASPLVTYEIFANLRYMSRFDVNVLTYAWMSVIFIYAAFISVAIWRSAENYILAKPAKKKFGVLAQIAVVIGALGTLSALLKQDNKGNTNNEQQLQIDMAVAGLNKDLPKKIDGVTTLVRENIVGNNMIFYYFIDPVVASKEKTRQNMTKKVTNAVCLNPEMRDAMSKGTVYEYVYSDKDAENWADIKVASVSCL